MATTLFATTRRPAGYTLIEVLITVGIVGILAAIAVPSYSNYVMRSKIIDATTTLGDTRNFMEKYFMDNRTYVTPGGLCAANDPVFGTIPKYNALASSNFQISCPAFTATTYTLRADGIPARGMGGFWFEVNEGNNKVTRDVPAYWKPLPVGLPVLCWVTRKDGSCG